MIRLLHSGDVEACAKLRREALLDAPLAFASSPEDDVGSKPEAIREVMRRGPDAAIFGAFRDGLVGSLSLHRDRHVKSSHKAHLFGMYVAPDSRRRGIARRLLAAALDHARSLPGVDAVQLSVSEAAPEALRLYRASGFERWGTEPDALRYEGRRVAEHHMMIQLGEG